MPDIYYVGVSQEFVSILMELRHIVTLIAVVIIVVLTTVSMIMISNTTKASIFSRREEIQIMKYVGATNGFIRTPFMIEGVIIGLISAVISILVVGGGYNYITNKLYASQTFQELNISLLSFNELFGQIILVYMLLGVGIGIVGSSISMKKYLEV